MRLVFITRTSAFRFLPPLSLRRFAPACCLVMGMLFGALALSHASENPIVSLLNTDFGKLVTARDINAYLHMYNAEDYQTANERNAQNWRMEDVSENGRPLLRFRSISRNDCMRIVDSPVDGNFPVRYFPCDGADHENWIVRPLYDGSSIVLENALRNGHCLEGQSSELLFASPCRPPYDHVLNQRWILAPPRPLP